MPVGTFERSRASRICGPMQSLGPRAILWPGVFVEQRHQFLVIRFPVFLEVDDLSACRTFEFADDDQSRRLVTLFDGLDLLASELEL